MRLRLRLLVAPLAAAAALIAPSIPAAAADSATAATGTAGTPSDECSAAFHHGDARLGPEDLPTTGPVGDQLVGYQRTGGAGDQEFLAKYYDPTANGGKGSWIYPPVNGYATLPDGSPIEFDLTLYPNQNIDRYGSEYGAFLAPEGLPYANRAIPPQSLDGNPPAGCNYHDYKVVKEFTVHAGPIAPWFNQPGWGLQYQLDAGLLPGGPAKLNVMWLVDNGYLARI
ncbi:TNT domain-containing protein [Kitasatospora aureofaciens]|uniref:TNT domain-containing protein n=1 Tax=Kitasatospora aureofaciens TaxID=1894 RepID=UPI001C47DAF1|nr:TNT domain-containing protein [Kitasatospora aureofaciens]MBV6702542.1 TNT domain-containing protein [Kitasatospora aureofaciens]